MVFQIFPVGHAKFIGQRNLDAAPISPGEIGGLVVIRNADDPTPVAAKANPAPEQTEAIGYLPNLHARLPGIRHAKLFPHGAYMIDWRALRFTSLRERWLHSARRGNGDNATIHNLSRLIA
ncbi:MAG: hypothetical protein JHD33_06235 [Chthoniobacterales bacterium]|nr:hypothetical protein [Chthoniobacterales bacterium]